MDLESLLGIGDVVPAAVSFPTFGDDLDQNSAERCIGDVGHAFTICFYIEFEFVVLLELVLLDVLDVHAGVFDGHVFFTAADFNGDAAQLFGRGRGRRRIRGWRILSRGVARSQNCGGEA